MRSCAWRNTRGVADSDPPGSLGHIFWRRNYVLSLNVSYVIINSVFRIRSRTFIRSKAVKLNICEFRFNKTQFSLRVMYIMLHVNSLASPAGDCHPSYEPGDTRFQVKRHRICKCDNCGNVVPFAGKAHTYQLQWCANRLYIFSVDQFLTKLQLFVDTTHFRVQVSPICQLFWMPSLKSEVQHAWGHKFFTVL